MLYFSLFFELNLSVFVSSFVWQKRKGWHLAPKKPPSNFLSFFSQCSSKSYKQTMLFIIIYLQLFFFVPDIFSTQFWWFFIFCCFCFNPFCTASHFSLSVCLSNLFFPLRLCLFILIYLQLFYILFSLSVYQSILCSLVFNCTTVCVFWNFLWAQTFLPVYENATSH